MKNNLALVNFISTKAYNFLQRHNLVIKDTGGRPVFYAWPLDDRLVLVIDPETITRQNQIVANDDFRHDLSTILGGRRVVVTNSRGIYVQVAYTPPPTTKALRSLALDLSQQPGPLHVPLGMRRDGPFWQPITALGVVILGGVRGMGKTRIIHGMIQALLNGGSCELYLDDGKRGVEFGRYGLQEGVHLIHGRARQGLMDVLGEVNRRNPILMESGATSVEEHNEMQPSKPLKPIVVVIDETSLLPKDCFPLVDTLVGTGRYAGVYLILATTYPTQEYIWPSWKANATCIALPVPTYKESVVILGRKGAEDLPNVQGRMLMEWQARLIELQAFRVTLPVVKSAYMGPTLAGRELEAARQACEGDGVVTIELFKKWIGDESDWRAYKTLREWEGRGWLVKDPDKSNSRCVTRLLRELITKSSETPKSPESPKTDLKPDLEGETA